nr:MAG TPA: hypothetical protein [Caudoviricetes sp.]
MNIGIHIFIIVAEQECVLLIINMKLMLVCGHAEILKEELEKHIMSIGTEHKFRGHPIRRY